MVYVDDLVLIGDLESVQSMEKKLNIHFEMSDRGPLSNCLGLQLFEMKMDFISHRSSVLRRCFDGVSSPSATLAVLSAQIRNSERNLELFSRNIILHSVKALLVRSCT
jgi:hypothetical protein